MDPAVPTFARVVRLNTTELTTADFDRVESFISRYTLYERAVLEAQLRAATYIWLCLDSKGRIVGTTAVRRLRIPAGTGGHTMAATVVYTSVVAVNPAYRRLGLPARMGLKTYMTERLRAPVSPLYWVAEAVSPAGYLLMARNLRVFWPSPGRATPARTKAVIEATLAAAGVTRIDRVGDAYIVHEDYPVIEREQAPDKWNRADADVDFFLRTNPDYWAGAAIVCLTPLNLYAVGRSVTGVALKVLRRKLTGRKSPSPVR